ncbi:uncharacterized protein JCM10292_001448 [Rhodotorula paludigena]|uniref:uncharacterized protein n=1 Tax=Rhodotorula paludigena TaxID=86838 RepID=UPI00318173F7
MSRRDEALSAVDTILDIFSARLNAALDQSNANSVPGAVHAAARRAPLPTTEQPPPPAAYSSPSSPDAVERGAYVRSPITSTPFSYGATHQSFPIEPLANRAVLHGETAPSPAPPLAAPTAAPAEDGDALPGYTRRAPPAPRRAANGLPPKRLHVLSSKTGKLNLEMRAHGQDHVVLIQENPDEDASLAGVLDVKLKDPESITHIKIRLKGLVRTLVMKAHASGRHPVSDEIDFVEDSRTLWTAAPPGDVPPPLAGNTSNDPTKLQGSFSFPFSLTVPGRIFALPGSDALLERPFRPPPSFVLDSALAMTVRQRNEDATTNIGFRSGGLSTGGFEASSRYYLKVTLGRKGLLKLNERWIIPVVFVPRQLPPTFSPARELALRQGLRPPSSKSDPQGWIEPGKYRSREQYKRGVFKARSGWVEVEGKVPRPQKFQKGSVLDFEVQITSSDPSQGRFPPSSLAVSLLQHTIVTAQRLTNALDTVILRAQAVRAIGPPLGEPVKLGKDGKEDGWRITYGGQIKLGGTPPSFRAPNLQVAYELAITLYQPGPRDVVTSTHIATLGIPVEIVNCPPRETLTTPLSGTRTVQLPSSLVDARRPSEPSVPVSSFFQGSDMPPEPSATIVSLPAAIAEDAPGSPHLAASPPPPPPPPAADPHNSSESPAGPSRTRPVPSAPRRANTEPNPVHAVLVSGPGMPAAASSSHGDVELLWVGTADGAEAPMPRYEPPAAIDSVEERRLEEEFGLPPSYFDVVEARRR